jgi:hypothetical protein
MGACLTRNESFGDHLDFVSWCVDHGGVPGGARSVSCPLSHVIFTFLLVFRSFDH